MRLLSVEGPFQRYGTMIFDIILLNLFWLLCVVLTLGIGTGAATTALFYTVDKSIIRERSYITFNFFRSFKSNFIQATVSWLLLVLAFGIIIANLVILDAGKLPFGWLIVVINGIVLYELVLVTIYIFPLISKIELGKTKEYFFESLKLANSHFISSWVCIITMIITGIIQYVFPLYIMAAVGIIALIHSKIIVGRVLKKYYGEEILNA